MNSKQKIEKLEKIEIREKYQNDMNKCSNCRLCSHITEAAVKEKANLTRLNSSELTNVLFDIGRSNRVHILFHFFCLFSNIKKGTRFYFNGTQMDFDEKYKDYTGTFLLNQKVKSKKDAERKREVTNGQLPTNRQNGVM